VIDPTRGTYVTVIVLLPLAALLIMLIAYRRVQRASAKVDQIIRDETCDPESEKTALFLLEKVRYHAPHLQRAKISELKERGMLPGWVSAESMKDYYSLTIALRLKVEAGRRTLIVTN
jgi:hypothetical protein